MNNPALYLKSNPFQIRDSIMVLKNYQEKLNDNTDTDAVLDIGCGVGDVTSKIISSSCQRYHHLVGVDVSEEMIQFARENYGGNKISYEVMDISNDVQDFKNRWGCFSKIFSFYCLHWVKDHRAVMRNIASLLSTDGECLLVFVAKCPVFSMYERMAANSKWTDYMKDVEKFVPNSQHSAQPAYDFARLIESFGLKIEDCKTVETGFTFPNIQMLCDSMSAVNPFISRIPTHMRDDYIRDCLSELAKINQSKHENNNLNEDLSFSYKLLIAHARKA